MLNLFLKKMFFTVTAAAVLSTACFVSSALAQREAPASPSQEVVPAKTEGANQPDQQTEKPAEKPADKPAERLLR